MPPPFHPESPKMRGAYKRPRWSSPTNRTIALLVGLVILFVLYYVGCAGVAVPPR